LSRSKLYDCNYEKATKEREGGNARRITVHKKKYIGLQSDFHENTPRILPHELGRKS